MDGKTTQPGRLTTGPARFSYAHLFEPQGMKDAKELKYSVVLLFPKTDKASYAALVKAQNEAKEAGKAGTKSCNWGGKIPAGLELGLKDGDVDKPGDTVYAGMWYINAKSGDKPPLVDVDKNPILDKTDCKSGDYGRASVTFYPYDKTKGGKNGVAVALNSVQKLKDGAPLGYSSNIDEDFAEELGEFEAFGADPAPEEFDDLA